MGRKNAAFSALTGICGPGIIPNPTLGIPPVRFFLAHTCQSRSLPFSFLKKTASMVLTRISHQSVPLPGPSQAVSSGSGKCCFCEAVSHYLSTYRSCEKCGLTKNFYIALLMLFALLGLPATGAGQSPGQTENNSTIFALLDAKQKQSAAARPEIDMKKNSPVRQTVFEQPDSAPAILDEGVPMVESGGPIPGAGMEYCPECGGPTNHPIMGTCDECQSGMGPCRRLFCMLRPRAVFGDLCGSKFAHEPWINRPFSIGVFVGPVVGSPLMDDWVGQQTGTLAGMRFGWDFDDDWGMEMRLATANVPIYDSESAILAEQEAMIGLPLDTPYGTRNADHFFWDIDFLYYPWGDAHFRPYLLFGVGTDRIKFTDRLGNNYARILLGMPVGLGIKTHLNNWMIFRVECTDNMAFAGGSIFQSQHNISLTGAFEVRLGRSRIQYWPWNPGK
jgi:hypothetical protein